MKRLIPALLLLAVSATCYGQQTFDGTVVITGHMTVSMTVSSSITSVSVACTTPITSAQTSTCTPTVTGSGGFSPSVTWGVTSGTGSVDSSGVFTPSGTGTSTITATSVQDGTKSGSASVVVTSVPSSVTGISVSCVTPITTAQTSACTAIVSGTGPFSSSVTWAVTSGGGSVSSAGLFTPAGAGSSTITATSVQDGTKTGSASVTVNGIVGGNCGTDGVSSYPTLASSLTGCGNVSHTFAAQSSPTHLTVCNTSLTTGGHYILDNNIGFSPSTKCLGGSGTVEVNLNGHTVTGWAFWNATTSMSGFHIYNGTINCNNDTGGLATAPACIMVEDSVASSWPTPLHFEYLTVHNSNTTASNNPHTIMVDGNSGASTPTAANIIFNNIDSTPATNVSTTRITNIQVNNQGAWIQAHDNHTTCLSTSTACQGFVAYGVAKLEHYNNWITNQQMATGTGDSPRGVICDTLSTATTGLGTYKCDIHDNYCDAKDGRCFRTRAARTAHVWNNIIDNVTPPVSGTDGTSAAVHLGNPDSGNDSGTTLVEYNQLTLGSNNGSTSGSHVGGLPFLVADTSGTGWKLQHNSLTCPSGLTCSNTPTWVNLRNVNGAGGQVLTVYNTTFTGSISTPQNNVESSGTLTLCNSGTASGSGTKVVNNTICGSLP